MALDVAGALTRVSNKLPFLRVALSWRPSLFPLGDLDIGHNIWGLVQDPLTRGREHFQDRGEGLIIAPVLRQDRKVQCKSKALL